MPKDVKPIIKFGAIYDDMQKAVQESLVVAHRTVASLDLGQWIAGPKKVATAPIEKETAQWISLQEPLRNAPESVLKPLGIYIGGAGHTSLERGTYASNLWTTGNVTIRTSVDYTVDCPAVWTNPMERTVLATRDTVGRASWAVAVTEDFYTQYGVLPLDSKDVLYTQYSGHDWALIHQALCNNSSVQLLDGLTVYCYANAIDVSHSDNTQDIHPNVLYMIDLIEQALHPTNPRHTTVVAQQTTFYTIQEYITWYTTPLPPQPDIDTGQ